MDLGKNSLLQSCAINKNADTIGLSTFDGRSNISNIVKSASGVYTQVKFSYKFRKLSSHSSLTNFRKIQAISSCIQSMQFHSHLSVTSGSWLVVVMDWWTSGTSMLETKLNHFNSLEIPFALPRYLRWVTWSRMASETTGILVWRAANGPLELLSID